MVLAWVPCPITRPTVRAILRELCPVTGCWKAKHHRLQSQHCCHLRDLSLQEKIEATTKIFEHTGTNARSSMRCGGSRLQDETERFHDFVMHLTMKKEPPLGLSTNQRTEDWGQMEIRYGPNKLWNWFPLVLFKWKKCPTAFICISEFQSTLKGTFFVVVQCLALYRSAYIYHIIGFPDRPRTHSERRKRRKSKHHKYAHYSQTTHLHTHLLNMIKTSLSRRWRAWLERDTAMTALCYRPPFHLFQEI